LQEHAGIHDSHAELLLASERAVWEAGRQQADEAMQKAVAVVPDGGIEKAGATAAPPPPVDPVAEPAVAKPPSDEAWIETARCPSCNECQNINDKMFTYNDNKQAYIKDIDAGTYRQLVEAAEACQVAIIHPGKPRNPSEPGLEDLVKRAAAFS
jgi:ferredoxin